MQQKRINENISFKVVHKASGLLRPISKSNILKGMFG